MNRKILNAFVAPLVFVCLAAAFIAVAEGSKVNLDEDGIPIVDYGYVSSKGSSFQTKKDNCTYIGEQRSPLIISMKGIEYYDQYAGGNNSSKQLFLNCANWLVENAHQKDDCLVWEYNYSWPTYNNTPPWISGLAQAKGIELLALAYNNTNNNKYTNCSADALKAFFISVNEGGLTYKDPRGWWFEEYAQPQVRYEPRVLNGHISAILSIYRNYNITGDMQAKYLFDLGIQDLKDNLASYDTGNWSSYDMVGNPASKGYHRAHIIYLGKLYNITGDPFFRLYKDKWTEYEKINEMQADIDALESLLRRFESNLKGKEDEMSLLRNDLDELNQNISMLSKPQG